MSPHKDIRMQLSTAALCIAALLAMGCTPAQPTKQDAHMTTTTIKDPITKEDWHRATTTDDFGTQPLLVNEEHGIYRFAGGACRRMLPAFEPWTQVEENGRPMVNHLGVAYQARNNAFGIPVPAGELDPIEDRRQEWVDVGFASPQLEDWRDGIVREALTQPERSLRDADFAAPYSPSFRAVATEFPDGKAIIHRGLAAGVYCEDAQLALPNPACRGVVLLDEHESATFTLTLAGLPKLEEVVRSIHALAAALRTDCPAKD